MNDQSTLDNTFANCLNEIEMKATVDMQLLSEKVVDCTNEMTGIGTSTNSMTNENDADTTEANVDNDDDDDKNNPIEIIGQLNNSNVTT